MSLIATHSGLRGRPGIDLTADEVERAVARLTQLVRQRGGRRSIGVGRDERSAGEELAAQVIEAALARGMDVVDFGVVSTPGAKLASRRRDLGATVVITGSHLAPELNGLKLIAAPTYAPIDVGDLPEPAEIVPAGERGRLRREGGAAEEHVAAICASVDVALIRAGGLAVTCGGGAGPAPPLLMSRLGCEAGVAGSPDLCLHLDADGDRLRLEDERGVAHDAELTFPLTLEALNPSIVVKGADTSRIVDVLAGRRGATVLTVPPGEIHLVEALASSGAELAGEGNGGVIVSAVGPARDGLAAAAALIGLLARHGGPLSALAAELPPFARRRSTVPCSEPERARACLDAVGRRLGIEVGDPHVGVRVESGNGAWGLARLSATEPVLRITAEAETESEANELHAELRASLLTAAPGP